MRILMIGGTRFVGRAVTEAALAAGHDVTLLHRGGQADAFPEATHLHVDRDGDLSALAEGTWDATVDVCAYLPSQVRRLAAALGGRGGHHVFVSTVSVYAEPPAAGAGEDSELMPAAGDDQAEVTNETYGPLKVACEQACLDAYGPDAVALVRPTYVVGPYDTSGRYPWWVIRAARGGRMIAPAPRDAPMQLVDARDQGEWIIRLAEQHRAGAFTSAQPGITYEQMLQDTLSGTGSNAELVWIDAAWLKEHEVDGLALPLWTEGTPEYSLAMSAAAAQAAGLASRPLADTARDTLAWARDVGEETVLRPMWGLSPERESVLLDAWDAR
jgi:nucleoside-diphosphate-sugar epimerase